MLTPGKVKQWAMGLIGIRTLSASAANRKEQVEGHQTDEDDPDYQHPVERMQHYGFRSRPGPGARLVTLAPEGGTSQRVSVASEVPGTGPDDQEDKEVEVYCAEGQRLVLDVDGDATLLVKDGKKVTIQTSNSYIRIGTDGAITIQSSKGVTIDAGAPADVVVNGGVLKVARETDPVDPHGSMSAWIAAVQTICAALAVTAGAPAPVAPTNFGNIRVNAGAARFKG